MVRWRTYSQHLDVLSSLQYIYAISNSSQTKGRLMSSPPRCFHCLKSEVGLTLNNCDLFYCVNWPLMRILIGFWKQLGTDLLEGQNDASWMMPFPTAKLKPIQCLQLNVSTQDMMTIIHCVLHGGDDLLPVSMQDLRQISSQQQRLETCHQRYT